MKSGNLQMCMQGANSYSPKRLRDKANKASRACACGAFYKAKTKRRPYEQAPVYI